MVVPTALGGAWIVQQATAPSGSEVTLVVDGTRQRVRTDADSVGALLAAAHVQLGAGDVVVPAAASALHDGIHVDVLRAFPVTVDVNGKVRSVRTIETSADKLAKQLKLNKLTAVRNDPGRLAAGTTVVYRTRVSGALTIDDQKVTFDSPSRTVDELLQSYKVKLVGEDYAIPSPDTVLHDGDQVAVVRVGASTSSTTQPIDFDTVQQDDPTLPIGQTRVIQDGKDGVMTITSRQLIENGQKGDKQVVSEVPTVEPTPKIIGIGSYANPKWDELATCESGGRWDTVDAARAKCTTAASASTGAPGRPSAATSSCSMPASPPEQQIIVGMRIYEKYGWDSWGCVNNVLDWPQWSM